jgi:adenylyltransferase/sulfurtransferase
MANSLSQDEKSRYLRHILLGNVGEAGQLKLKNSSVLCIGAGGLGSPILLYLAAAGVGRIGIVDSDHVDQSNLQRQVLFNSNDVMQSKAELAKKKLLQLNPYIQVDVYPEYFNAQNAEKLLGQYDAIIDGTDNFATRYLVNDVAVKLNKPNFFGCIYQFTGQLSVFGTGKGCYRCLFPSPPSAELSPDCSQAGVLGVLPGLVGTYQALEYIKWVLGIGESLAGKLMFVDTLNNSFRTVNFSKNPECETCSKPSEIKIIDYDFTCALPSNESWEVKEISVQELKNRMDAQDKKSFVLIDVREKVEYEIGNIGGILIPLGELANHLDKIPKTGDVFIHCKVGGRSAKACEKLMSLGYTNVINVSGGMVAWKQEIDSKFKI